MRVRSTCVVVVSFLAFVASVALAQATVTVQVRGSAGPAPEGTVRLTTSGTPPQTFSCHTSANVCTLAAVPGGMHNVTFTPDGGGQATSRSVMVPPSGTVSLIISLSR